MNRQAFMYLARKLCLEATRQLLSGECAWSILDEVEKILFEAGPGDTAS